MFNNLNNDTIAAIATVPGKSAIGIIRISGADSIPVVARLFRGKDITHAATHTIHLGTINDDQNKIIDQVLISVFKNPGSYTGEDVIEISCHGSVFILNHILNLLLSKGIRLAEPGEFTFRAFINRKMDLSQAEAVADIVNSSNSFAHQLAFSHFRGGYSEKMKLLRNQLLDLKSLFELEVDFGEEDVEFATNDQLLKLLNEIKSEVTQLTESFRLGNVIKQGVSVVIAGKPNAGKSTLLNTLLNEERAITSTIPGTTRDFIEDSINIEGIQFRFTDTAGLTKGKDEIEKKGIEKTHEKLKEADIVIYLFDITLHKLNDLRNEIDKLQLTSPLLIAANKIDKIPEEEIPNIQKAFSEEFKNTVFISSKFKLHIEDLKNQIVSLLNLDKYKGEQSIVTNARHFNILSSILASITDIESGISQNLSKDLLTTDIHQILSLMSEITGEITNEEVLGNIFGRFCIGK